MVLNDERTWKGCRLTCTRINTNNIYSRQTKLTRLAMCLADLRARFMYVSFWVYFDNVPNSSVNLMKH